MNDVRRFGPFVFDRHSLSVTRGGISHRVGTRGAALLDVLLRARGQALDRQSLLNAGWSGAAIEDANLTVQIAALRKVLGQRDDGREWIETIPRVGYRLLLPVVDEASAWDRRPSIAVLPFENLSSETRHDHLADGIVEDVITALSRFRTLAVIARNSSFAYKGLSLDVRRVAAELGVGYLLEGSVRPLGTRIRITAQLIEGTTGKHLWAERFDRDLANIFDVQDEITDTVASFIEPQIRKAELERVRRKRPDRLDTWDLYVQAVPLVHGTSISGYSQAIALLETAIGIDPSYAPALALSAWAHEKRHTFSGPSAGEETDAEKALELASRAVSADGDDALALAQLGWQRIILRADYTGLKLCDKAITINHNNVPALHFAGNAHLFAGDLDLVTKYFMRALKLSPAPPDNYVSLNGIASGHFSAGRYEEAIGWARRTVEAAPDYIYGHIFLAASSALTGRQREARLAIDAVLELRPDLTVAGQSSRPMRFPERRARMLDGLRKAGLPER